MSAPGALSHFEQLLATARAQPDAQRLLFVFTTAELPADATAEQRARFERGQGGALAPLMCVDKAPQELDGFAALAEEAKRAGPPWQVVFVAALSGRGSVPPEEAKVDAALQRMVEGVKAGRVAGYLAYDSAGQPLRMG